MRTRLLLLAGLLAACASPPQAPTHSPGHPAAQVRQTDDGTVEIAWGEAGALWVEVRHAATGRIVWRATAGPAHPRRGPDLLEPPLAVRALGPPPGIYPPDGRGAEAGEPEPFVPGDAYTVTVLPCPTTPTGCEPLPLHTASFITRH